MDLDNMISVINAHKNGEVIETFVRDQWMEVEKPCFNFSAYEYRVKPKKKYQIIKNSHGTFVSVQALKDLVRLVDDKFMPDGDMTGEDWFLIDCIREHVKGPTRGNE